ncbi:MAG: FmdE family protein [Nitrospira sp.]|nr:FmdE family protein [Nitrospira sp.]
MGVILGNRRFKAAMVDRTLEYNIEKTTAFHGHLCPGTVIGTRMGLVGMREIGITDPTGSQRKDMMVYIETDRCPVDAISIVTGCRISRKNLKFLDWGKVAATFVNLKSGKAIRILCPDSCKDHINKYVKGEYSNDKDGKTAREVAAYKVMPENELFVIQEVKVDIPVNDKEKFKVKCEVCGETVNNRKEIVKDGRIMCKPCGEGESYYHAG